MDSTYIGVSGRLKALSQDFLKKDDFDDMYRRGKEDFVPALSNTSYKEEITDLYTQYKEPELVEAIINSHMMKNVRNAVKLIPTGSRPVLEAYLSKWDIENIRLILYSKVRHFDVGSTDAFLVIDRTMPVSTYSGFITKEDYANMIAQKSVEDVIESASKYWYGTKLMEAINSIKGLADIDKALLRVEIAYYENLLEKFRFYNGDEGVLYRFFKELIDIRNITTAIRFRENQVNDGLQFAEGGDLSKDVVNSILTSSASEWGSKIPYNVSAAIKIYQESRLLSFISTGMLGDLYRKYLPILKSNMMSLDYILYYIIRAEIERKELLAIWFKVYNNISDTKAELIRMTNYVDI
ncbi:MAG: V-type ATPase subunit [Candidatus Parvarchaeota archaeon]|nr:V-type ATPase subunit [Candidatus Parvarchaeota archaeon]